MFQIKISFNDDKVHGLIAMSVTQSNDLVAREITVRQGGQLVMATVGTADQQAGATGR